MNHHKKKRAFALFTMGLVSLLSSSLCLADISVTGRVFADNDADGVYSEGDKLLPDVRVAWEIEANTRSDANGEFTLEVPWDGIIWARTPDGYSPAPSWCKVTAEQATCDLALVPSLVSGNLTFVHASDTHVGLTTEGELRAALKQASEAVQGIHFVTVTGDLTDNTIATQFRGFIAASKDIEVPIVPVVGNHDWYDSGPEYRAAMGPPMYSFEVNDTRFVVINFMASQSRQSVFLRAELSDAENFQRAIVLSHAPLTAPMVSVLEELGVEYAFTGHNHANKRIAHADLVEFNTQPLVFGGIDWTPAGFRIIREDDSKALNIEHRETLTKAIASVSYPLHESCVETGPLDVLASVAAPAEVTKVFVGVDDIESVRASPVGGWMYQSAQEIVPSADGWHEIVLTVVLRGGAKLESRTQVFECQAGKDAAPSSDWQQLQSTAQRHGQSAATISPPLLQKWSYATGGQLRGGSPVLSGGILIVPVVDFADGSTGGVVALDATTGTLLWEHRGKPVHNAPAISDDTVVYIDVDGAMHARDLRSGDLQWLIDTGLGQNELIAWMYESVAIQDGVVYGGNARNFAAVDLQTGDILWRSDPAPMINNSGHYSSPSLSDSYGISSFSTGRDALVGWDLATGEILWRHTWPVSKAVYATPIVDGDVAYVVDYDGFVRALDMENGEVSWEVKFHKNDADWSKGILGTPALHDGVLYIPSTQGLFAVDIEKRSVLWTVSPKAGITRPSMYSLSTAGFLAAPVVAGEVLWAGGADGRLCSYAKESGEAKGCVRLPSPILSGLVPSAPMLFVGTLDGSIHAFVAVDESEIPRFESGCGCSQSGSGGGPWGVLLTICVGLALRRRRPMEILVLNCHRQV